MAGPEYFQQNYSIFFYI